MIPRILIIPLLLSLTFTSFSQKILTITDVQESNKVFQDYIEVFADTSNTIDFDLVSSESFRGKFVPLSEFNEELSYSSAYWLHFVLEFSPENLVPLGLQIPIENQLVDVFALLDSKLIRQRSGVYVIVAENDEIIPNSNILQISGTGRIEYYLKIQNTKFRLPVFNLKLVDLRKEISKKDRRDIFQSFMQGIMFLMIIYGLFLYYHTREKLYLFYCLYIICISLWAFTSLSFQLIYSIPRVVATFLMVFGYFAFFFYIKFVRSFLDTASYLPKWDRILRKFQNVLLIAIVGLHVPIMFFDIYFINEYLHGLIVLAYIILIILFIVRVYQSDIQFSHIIWIGTSLLILGTIGSFILFFLRPGITDHQFNYQRIGTLLELIVFSYGITLKYKTMELEKRQYQEELITQLQENARIQEKANIELEGKVKERTREIAHKNEILESQKKEIEEQHNSIKESIGYAEKIQSALLPPEAYVNELLNENFIYFKPRDIVSGDFYWIKQVNEYTLVIAADCTGHGVPGALMSMLGISFLNEIVQRREITQANQVLNELRYQIKHSLRQHGDLEEAKDGMDIALCAINNRNRKMQYAGAYNPLYLIRDVEGKPELREIKADRMPLSYYQGKDKSFLNHEIQLEIGDTFYLFSDGFMDQKGGTENKKFMSKEFKKLLLEIHDQPMGDQKQILDKVLSDWMGDHPQMDDVLVIGVRV